MLLQAHTESTAWSFASLTVQLIWPKTIEIGLPDPPPGRVGESEMGSQKDFYSAKVLQDLTPDYRVLSAPNEPAMVNQSGSILCPACMGQFREGAGRYFE